MRTLSLQGAAQHHTGLKWQTQVLNFNRLPPKSMVMIFTIAEKGRMGRWMDRINEQKHKNVTSEFKLKISF